MSPLLNHALFRILGEPLQKMEGCILQLPDAVSIVWAKYGAGGGAQWGQEQPSGDTEGG